MVKCVKIRVSILYRGEILKMTEKEQKKAAKEFSQRWKDKGYEKGDKTVGRHIS